MSTFETNKVLLLELFNINVTLILLFLHFSLSMYIYIYIYIVYLNTQRLSLAFLYRWQ